MNCRFDGIAWLTVRNTSKDIEDCRLPIAKKIHQLDWIFQWAIAIFNLQTTIFNALTH